MRRLPWDILFALLAGFGLGLAYAWMISPLRTTDAAPAALRDDFKDHYRSAIAAAYAASGNLPRAQVRISLLQDPDPIQALNAQAQRMLANGEPFQQTDQVAALALALGQEPGQSVPTSLPATEAAGPVAAVLTVTIPTSTPEDASPVTETPPVPAEGLTQLPTQAPTPRPTQTPVPTLGAPYTLAGQNEVCDANLPDGLLQVIVINSSRRQMPGMEIVVAWDGGEQQFFTGLKPELGNGYADFIMTPEVSYTVQLAAGSDVAAGLVAPTCQTANGENFFGGYKLTFQQP
jgi:hypothetical protein